MKSIKEKAEEHLNSVYAGYDNVLKTLVKEGYEAGANCVLEQIENFINGLDLGNSAEEKFYKLDVIADIGLFIKQLKK